jgi:hypothetical protein
VADTSPNIGMRGGGGGGLRLPTSDYILLLGNLSSLNRVRTCQRVKFKDFPRTFKGMYRQIQALNTEEKALEISKI